MIDPQTRRAGSRRIRHLAPLAGAGLLLAACASPTPGPAAKAPPLPVLAIEDAVWMLFSIDGAPAGAEARFVIGDGRINGSGPCNAIQGRYDRVGDGFVIAALLSTKRACPGLSVENAMLDGLLLAETATVRDGRLSIASPEGPRLVFTPENG